MKAWIVFDSTWGNTQAVARSIGESLGAEARVSRATEAKAEEAGTVDLLIVGSPTLGGRPAEPVRRFLQAIRPASVAHVRFAAFDTRVSMKFARIFGYAADKIAASLAGKGATQAAKPEGFFVRGKQGPLLDNELERAAQWARGLASQS